MSHTTPSAWRQNVAAIIMDDTGRVLLGSNPHSSPYRHFPQGGVKEGESATEALQRELREEVGLRHCRILAEYAGLRYEYQGKNSKRKIWQGQQQTYYWLHCPGAMPPVDCSGSAEFTHAEWLLPGELSPEIFVPFKREVAARVIQHFFPGGTAAPLEQCTPLRYRFEPGQIPVPGTHLFAGGKHEAAYHLEHLTPQPPGKHQQLMLILIGMQGSGLKKSLRHIAPMLDVLSTRCFADARRYKGLPAELHPLPGELSILALPTDAAELPRLPAFAAALHARGISTLSIGLHISQAKQISRLAQKGKEPDCPYAQACRELDATMQALPGPRYLLPTDHAWYRDYLLSNILQHHLSL